MGNHFDIGYFKKPVKIRAKVAKERTVINKMYAWELGKEYYDGNRLNGYGGFKYDGRWQKLLPKIIKKYKLTKKSKVLDLGCKKGFLLKDLNILIPGIKSYGIENHQYALKKAVKCKSKLIKSEYYNIPFKNKYFDFVWRTCCSPKYFSNNKVKCIPPGYKSGFGQKLDLNEKRQYKWCFFGTLHKSSRHDMNFQLGNFGHK